MELAPNKGTRVTIRQPKYLTTLVPVYHFDPPSLCGTLMFVRRDGRQHGRVQRADPTRLIAPTLRTLPLLPAWPPLFFFLPAHLDRENRDAGPEA